MIYQQLPSVIHSYLMNRQHTRITDTEELVKTVCFPQAWQTRDDYLIKVGIPR